MNKRKRVAIDKHRKKKRKLKARIQAARQALETAVP